MNNARLLLSIVFTAIMIWLWYPYFSQDNSRPNNSADSIIVPDYIASELKQTSYDESGAISHKVTAEKMELYQELGFTHFSKPTFTLFSEQETWQLSADEATLYENKTLILERNVVAVNLTPEAMIDKITADNIRIDIKSSVMNSEQPVVLTGPNLKITGKGLRADLKAEIIELINHTRTIYYDQ